MSAIRSYTVYECPYCKETSKDQDTIEKCRRSCIAQKAAATRNEKKRIEFRDCVRLKITKFEDIQPVLCAEVEKRYGAKLIFTIFPENKLQKIYMSHNAPIGKRTIGYNDGTPVAHRYAWGWSGQAKGEVISNFRDLDFGELFSWTFCRRIGHRIGGFHTGTGSYGKKFDGSFGFFLEDFPILRQDYIDKNFVEKL